MPGLQVCAVVRHRGMGLPDLRNIDQWGFKFEYLLGRLVDQNKLSLCITDHDAFGHAIEDQLQNCGLSR